MRRKTPHFGTYLQVNGCVVRGMVGLPLEYSGVLRTVNPRSAKTRTQSVKEGDSPRRDVEPYETPV